MTEIKLKIKEERRIQAGHWWIFSNEIDGLDTSIEPGTLVRVMSHEGKQVGIGLFNPHSLIAVRLLLKGEGELAEDFVFENIDDAYTRRKEIGVRKCGRMCYGEAVKISDAPNWDLYNERNDAWILRYNEEIYQ